jgi:hypothetical protein
MAHSKVTSEVAYLKYRILFLKYILTAVVDPKISKRRGKVLQKGGGINPKEQKKKVSWVSNLEFYEHFTVIFGRKGVGAGIPLNPPLDWQCLLLLKPVQLLACPIL